MKIIDRYIIHKFLRTFLFVLLVFTLIAIVFDMSEKIDNLISEPVTVRQIIMEYYLPFIPWINSLLFPLYALITVVFITSRMAFNSEIIAMLSSGISFYRIAVPYLMSSALLAGIHFWALHDWVPRANKVFKSFENRYIFKRNVRPRTRDIHMFVAPDTKIYIGHYRPNDSTGIDFKLEVFDGDQLIYFLEARKISFIAPPNHWRIQQYTVRKRDSTGKWSFRAYPLQKLDTTLEMHPEDFLIIKNKKDMMTTAELDEYIHRQQWKGVGNTVLYEIEKHRRTTEPVSLIILTMLGLIIAGRKVRGGMGLHLALAITAGALYIFLGKVSITFSTNANLPPLLGVWMPNIVFGTLVLVGMRWAQK